MITRQNNLRLPWRAGKQQKTQHNNTVSRFYSQNISRIDLTGKTVKPLCSHTNLPTVVTQHLYMLQGKSHVSRGPILLLGTSICPMSRFAEHSH